MFRNSSDADGNGHGTHCAYAAFFYSKYITNSHDGSCSGTAAGSQFGVAKSANLIAVKVLSDAG